MPSKHTPRHTKLSQVCRQVTVREMEERARITRRARNAAARKPEQEAAKAEGE